MSVEARSRPALAWLGAALVVAALVGVAFAIAPRACKGGLEFYAGAGAIAIVTLVALPFAARIGRSSTLRAPWSLGFVVLGAAGWLGGLVLANVRFICGLGYL